MNNEEATQKSSRGGRIPTRLKAQQDGRYEKTLSLLEGFESDAHFTAKAELLRAMAHHRLRQYAEAVAHYDVFLDSLVDDMPKKDRSYVREYAMFYRSRAQAAIEPSTDIYSSLEELRKLQPAAPLLTRKEFDT